MRYDYLDMPYYTTTKTEPVATSIVAPTATLTVPINNPFFPEGTLILLLISLSIKKNISLSNNSIKIQYKKENFKILGSGDILFQEHTDYISYLFVKRKNQFKFDTSLKIKNNPLTIEFLNFEKNEMVRPRQFIFYENFEILNGSAKAIQFVYEKMKC